MNQLIECLKSYNIKYTEYDILHPGHNHLMIKIGWLFICDCFSCKDRFVFASGSDVVIVDNDIKCDHIFKRYLSRIEKSKL